MRRSAAQKVQAESQNIVLANEAINNSNNSSTAKTKMNLNAKELQSAGLSNQISECLQELVKTEDNGENPENFTEFQAELNIFIKTCIKYKQSSAALHDYHKALNKRADFKSKSKGNEEDFNHAESELELEKLVKFTKENFYNSESIKEILEKAKDSEKNEKNVQGLESQNVVKIEIEQRFPNRMKQFRLLGSLLRGADSHRNSKSIECISEILGLDSEDFKQVVFSKDFIPMDEQIQNPKRQIDIEIVKGKIPQLKNPPVDQDMKNIDQILSELELELENESKSQEEKSLKLKELKIKYEEIQRFFEKWENKKAEDIFKWAKIERENKSNLNISEAVAVADRANQLVTGGHRLRIPQIISLLIFLQDSPTSKSTGQLCQIQAGEGKTTIVAVLAVIKILQGEFSSVDVITSNSVLAEEAVREKSSFYHLFGITVTTNNNTEKEEDENHPVDSEETRSCYASQVVYGSIGNFQFDFLRDERGYRGDENKKEKFGYLILDEVDSMTIDGGGHLAKISTPLPGMEALKYFYIQIWHDIFPAAESQLEKELQEQFKNIDRFDEDEKLLDRRLKEIMLEKFQIYLEKNPVVCEHLKEFAKSSMEKWIDNAIYAKYGCCPNREYCITEFKVANPMEGQPKTEKKVVPIDYANTGVSMKDTIWSNALHQFVQLKHDLQLTSESLAGCCISNYGYINLYPRIFGMTGTLGSAPERELLRTMYRVQFARIPTFKPRKFNQLPGILVEDDLWTAVIAKETVSMAISSGRAVLIISQTIADSLEISDCLEDGEVFDMLPETPRIVRLPKVKKFFTQDDSNVLREPLNPGDVVVATNIAGRGADFCCSENLQKNGGLHVILTFYPDNERVKDQAVFRTSRQGQPGSARVILRQSDVRNLGLFSLAEEVSLRGIITSERLMDQVTQFKQQVEKQRIDLLKKVKVAQLFYEDNLHSKFRQFCLDNFSSSFSAEHYVLKDLKEFWAFWLEEQQQKRPQSGREKDVNSDSDSEKSDEITTDVADWELKLGEKASTQFQKILENPKCQRMIKEKLISHNPYYGIQQAEFHLQEGQKLKDAKSSLENAIKITKTPQILYSAYIKLFEISMEEGGVLLEKFKDTMTKVAIFGYFTNVKDEKYKENALKYLQKAEESLLVEINFLDSLVNQPQTTATTTTTISCTSNSTENSRISTNGKVVSISNQNGGKVNYSMIHLQSRLLSLNVHCQNVSSLKKEIEASVNNKNNSGLVVRSRISNYFETLQPETEDEKSLKSSIYPAETSELKQIGLETLYNIGEVHDAPTEVIVGAQIQITAGLSALGTGLVLPAAMPIVGPLAGTLISEGILDIVQELLHYNRATGFDLKSYAIAKITTYASTIFTMGLNALASCTKIVHKVAKACRSLADLLRKCPFMKTLCGFVAKRLDKIATACEKLIQATLAAQKVSRTAFAKSVAKSAAHKTKTRFRERVVNPKIEKYSSSFQPAIQQMVETTILTKMQEESNGEILKILAEMKTDQVLTVSRQILETSVAEDVNLLALNTSLEMAQSSNKWAQRLTACAIDQILTRAKSDSDLDWDRRVGSYFCKELSQKLKQMKNEGFFQTSEQKDEEQVKILLLKISKLLADQIYSLILGHSGKIAHTFTLNKKIKYSRYSEKPLYSEVLKKSILKSKVKHHENENEQDLAVDYKRARREALKILKLPNGVNESHVFSRYRRMALEIHVNRAANFHKVGAAKEFLLGETSLTDFFSACHVNPPEIVQSEDLTSTSTSDEDSNSDSSLAFSNTDEELDILNRKYEDDGFLIWTDYFVETKVAQRKGVPRDILDGSRLLKEPQENKKQHKILVYDENEGEILAYPVGLAQLPFVKSKETVGRVWSRDVRDETGRNLLGFVIVTDRIQLEFQHRDRTRTHKIPQIHPDLRFICKSKFEWSGHIPPNSGYEAGWVLADVLGGPGDESSLWNFYPQNPHFNKVFWRNEVELPTLKFMKENPMTKVKLTYVFDYPSETAIVPRGFYFQVEPPIPTKSGFVRNGYYKNPAPGESQSDFYQ